MDAPPKGKDDPDVHHITTNGYIAWLRDCRVICDAVPSSITDLIFVQVGQPSPTDPHPTTDPQPTRTTRGGPSLNPAAPLLFVQVNIADEFVKGVDKHNNKRLLNRQERRAIAPTAHRPSPLHPITHRPSCLAHHSCLTHHP